MASTWTASASTAAALDYRTDARERRVPGREAASPEERAVDVGRMAIGQDKLQVTPLQMAMVASAVANGGELMEPHMTDRIVDRDGRTVDRIQPRRDRRR